MGALEILSDPLCASGVVRYGAVRDWVSCSYADALDNNADCTLVLSGDSPSLGSAAMGNVLRLLTDDSDGVAEYRIRRLEDALTGPTVTVTATRLIQDLGDIVVSSVVGGLRTYAVAATLTPAQWITTYILPSLTRYGTTWVASGTITATAPVTISTSNITCLGLLELLVADSDYRPRLRRNGDTNYLLDVLNLNTAATRPVALVGRNVQALDRNIDGLQQATVVVPLGRVPTNDTARQMVGEYGAKVTASTATTVTLADPDGNNTPIYFAGQEVALWLEKQVPYRYMIDSTDGFNGFPNYYTATSNPKDVAYVSSQSELWVLIMSNTGVGFYIDVLDATTLAHKARINTGGGLWTSGTWQSLVYDVTTDKVYLGLSNNTVGNSNIRSYVASTRLVATTIALGVALVPRKGVRADNGRIYFTTGTTAIKRVAPATDTIAATLTTGTNTTGICYAASVNLVLAAGQSGTSLSKIDPTTDAVTNLALTINSTDVTWCPSNSRAYVSGTVSIKVVDVAGAMSVTATITGITNGGAIRYSALTGYVYCRTTNTNDCYVIDPATNTVIKTLKLGTAGNGNWGYEDSTEGVVYACDLQSTGTRGCGAIIPFYPANEGPVLRRQVTASTTAGVVTITGNGLKFVAGDIVWVRSDSAGTWRSELSDPATTAAYPPRMAILDRADLSGEHNYFRNQFVDTYVNQINADQWDRIVATGGSEFSTPHFVWRDPDANASVISQACAVLGNGAATNVIPLDGFPVGFVVQPGDFLTTLTNGSAMIVNRVVADGAGSLPGGVIINTLTAGVYAAPMAYVNNDPCTITRAGLTIAQIPSGNTAVAVLTSLRGAAGSGTSDLGCQLALPYIAGRSTAWISMTVAVWRQNFQPSTALQMVVYQGTTLLTTVSLSDATVYTDKALVQYTFSYQYTITNPTRLWVYARRPTTGAGQWAAYIFDVRAVLGPDPFTGVTPFRSNYLKGELFHAGQRKVRDLATPVVDYTVQVLEDDPAAPFVLGGTVTLQDPDRAITATPRVVVIRRTLDPDGANTGPVLPEITLSNRPADLTGALVDEGSL